MSIDYEFDIETSAGNILKGTRTPRVQYSEQHLSFGFSNDQGKYSIKPIHIYRHFSIIEMDLSHPMCFPAP